MNLDKLQMKLFKAARLSVPDDSVPMAFERRIMSRLADLRSIDGAFVLDRLLWRAAMVCVALVVALGLWSVQTTADKGPVSLEATVMSMAKQVGDSW